MASRTIPSRHDAATINGAASTKGSGLMPHRSEETLVSLNLDPFVEAIANSKEAMMSRIVITRIICERKVMMMVVDAIQPNNWSEKGELPRGKSIELAYDKILCPVVYW
jgi:hypothetical protein